MLPLIAAAAGTLVRGAGVRMAASAVAGEAGGGTAAAGRALQFGGGALQRNAAARTMRQQQNKPGPADDIARHPNLAAVGYGMTQPGLLGRSSQAYSAMLQPGQFG